ncbi:superfamily II DNA or RNA helicase [Melghiribacillus thermohalophilus]|uniref:Superfamily II DNA or RNA helicase n=1 Tax=Melghiribacillus thermohalophilus TaxID=1324956 RepID=A0A4R3N4U0_9BACI|nr:DEAD/DEAH box helicase [Melghiribacillus thermohalophilus]TCT21769.1 superfamily II DNA or RNA helicase [Melghiribacillus thermohalophilus]
MKEYPSEQDIEKALDLLIHVYGVPDKHIHALLGKDQLKKLNQLLADLGKDILHRRELMRLYIMRKGAELFAGHSRAIRELRIYLLKQLDDKKVEELYKKHPNPKKKITSVSYMYRELATKRWFSGGVWPRDFVKALGLPIIFAGISAPQTEKKEVFEDIKPRKRVPKLAPYQEKMKEEMLEVLRLEGNHTRCMLSLPTGGGKTRIAVESFIEWMQPRFHEGKYMIWIAQSEELCEQAITCIADMWMDKEFPETLRIYRYFGGNDIKPDALNGGAVVASIHQIHSRLKKEDAFIKEVLKNCGAMIIDEAHHAAANMYQNLFQKAKKWTESELFAVCGLTATPGRSDHSIHTLVDQFEAYLIKPEIHDDPEYAENPLKYFRDQGYLAVPKHYVYENNRPIKIDEDDIRDKEGEFTPEFLRVLAEDQERNKIIVEQLQNIPAGSPTLVYACTVEHAEFLASVMNSLGRTAVSISAKTPKSVRRMHIEAFKNGEIEFLFNFGVLTTGFDAPKTEYIVICRPTTSEVLYEQIVGRGLRGPKFGGTEECVIIDFADNILNLGPPLAYTRFDHLWGNYEERERV